MKYKPNLRKLLGLDRPYAEETTSQHTTTGPELETPEEAKERSTLQQLEV